MEWPMLAPFLLKDEREGDASEESAPDKGGGPIVMVAPDAPDSGLVIFPARTDAAVVGEEIVVRARATVELFEVGIVGHG